MLAQAATVLGVDPAVLAVALFNLGLFIAHKLGFNPLAVPLPVVPSPGPSPAPSPAPSTGRPLLDLLARLFGGGAAPVIPPPAPAPVKLADLVNQMSPADLVAARQAIDAHAAQLAALMTPAPAVPVVK